jgi:oxaloacetate decarboxylase alpha subunit
MARKLHFWETALRDAHQSLWATRMTSEMMEPILPTMDEAGYRFLGVAGSAVFESCIYYLAEDPWERLRMIQRLAPRTMKNVYIRSLNVLGWDLFADDLFPLTINVLKRYGITSINTFDALNDTRNMAVSIKATKDAGLYAVGSIVFSESPIHTDAHFVKKAKELVALGVDGVQIKDSGALLTPDRVRTLVPAIREAIGDKIDLHMHTHCTSSLGPLVALESLPFGVDVMHTAISPISHSTSNPPTEMIAREAVNLGYDVDLDMDKVDRVAEHFRQQAIKHNKPIGKPVAYDPGLFRHQVPGGMRSNLEKQMEDLGLKDKLPAVLDEIVRMREELGWPIMVSPMSQFIGVQALLNVVEGERYRTVQTEIKRYVLGWYGELAAPVDPNVLDKISDGEQPITERPGALLEPMVERFRREHGPFASDEELILATHFKPKLLDQWRDARKVRAGRPTARTPVATLVQELARRNDIRYAFVQKGGTRLTHVA